MHEKTFFWLYSSFPPETEYFKIINEAALKAEFLYACDLINDLEKKSIKGNIVEFGVFEGMWLSVLANHVESFNNGRDIWGFDSFDGLPKTDKNDLDCWNEGQYKANFDSVYKYLDCENRNYIHLIKGWFTDSLKSE